MESSISKGTKDPHCPTPDDVFTVRSTLLAFVPAELANLILNEAKYWPKATWSFKPELPSALRARVNPQANAKLCCLLTPKLCDLYTDKDGATVKVKMVCFKIVSHDQGWCSENDFPGPYEGSYTWFEAVIVRDSSFIHKHAAVGSSNAGPEVDWIYQALQNREDDPNYELVTVKPPNDENADMWTIQRNKRGFRGFELHTVVWTEEEAVDESILINETGRGFGGGFVSSLKMNDRIAVMARAQYRGWTNYIKSVELDIHYSV